MKSARLVFFRRSPRRVFFLAAPPKDMSAECSTPDLHLFDRAVVHTASETAKLTAQHQTSLIELVCKTLVDATAQPETAEGQPHNLYFSAAINIEGDKHTLHIYPKHERRLMQSFPDLADDPFADDRIVNADNFVKHFGNCWKVFGVTFRFHWPGKQTAFRNAASTALNFISPVSAHLDRYERGVPVREILEVGVDDTGLRTRKKESSPFEGTERVQLEGLNEPREWEMLEEDIRAYARFCAAHAVSRDNKTGVVNELIQLVTSELISQEPNLFHYRISERRISHHKRLLIYPAQLESGSNLETTQATILQSSIT